MLGAQHLDELVERSLARRVGRESGVSEALTEERYTATPPASSRCGSAAAVASAAPTTLVSKARRQVAASTLSTAASGPIPGAYTSASMPPSFVAACSIAARHPDS
jgi:hypothetical protein